MLQRIKDSLPTQKSSFETLLKRDNSASIHMKNL